METDQYHHPGGEYPWTCSVVFLLCYARKGHEGRREFIGRGFASVRKRGQ